MMITYPPYGVKGVTMRKTLGLDLGSNSLGWAVLDDVTGDILDKGGRRLPGGH